MATVNLINSTIFLFIYFLLNNFFNLKWSLPINMNNLICHFYPFISILHELPPFFEGHLRLGQLPS